MTDQPTPLATIQVRATVRDKLKLLAELNRRSMAGQVEWMVEQALADFVPPAVPAAIVTDQPQAG